MEGDIQYKPNSNEAMFPADKNAKKIQKILHNKYPELLQSDI
jgi:hypothetical protein